MKKRIFSIVLGFVMLFSFVQLTGCSDKKDSYTPISGLDTDKKVTLKIAIPYETDKALNTVANDFMIKYPNVNIELCYVENYDTNAIKLFQENAMDIIIRKGVTYSEETAKDENGKSVKTGRDTDSFYYDFLKDTEIDFSNTAPEITDNFRNTRIDADGNSITYQYCYPLGGEMRGIFVNVSFLKSLGLSVPTNYTEFIDCCEEVKKAGYVPIQGNISTLAYGLGLSETANTLVHNQDAYELLSNAEAGVSGYLSNVYDKLNTFVENRYMDYKAVEASVYYSDSSEIGQVRSFLGLLYDKSTYETEKPENNIGYTAFFPYISSTETVIRNLIKENELDTELRFICSPLNDSGNASAYITPFSGICANKQSENLVWIREFVNFLFNKQNITKFAQNAAIIPNSLDAIDYACRTYNLNKNTGITLCGQIKFSDSYNAFKPLSEWVLTVCKGNAQKYMVKLDKDSEGNALYQIDENGNEYLTLGDGKTVVYKEFIGQEDAAMPGYAFLTKAYYMNKLENYIDAYRGK